MSFDNRPIDVGTRLGTMILDHLFMVFVIGIFLIPDIIIGFAKVWEISHEPRGGINMMPGFSLISVIGFAIYFAKDSLQGRSPAKRVFKLQVVNIATGEVASPVKCFLRNLLIFMWPVEVIAALINHERRLGDRLAGTELVRYDPEHHQSTFSWPKTLTAIALAYGFSLMLFKIMYLPLDMVKANGLQLVEASKNESRAETLATQLEEGLGKDFNADVVVYDQIEGREGIKYVSIILRMRYNYIEDGYEALKNDVYRIVDQEFDNEKIKGQVTYYFRRGSNMHSTTTFL